MTKKEIDYRELTQELDSLVDKLQTGELSVDEAVPAYERGMALVKQLETYLQSAENRISEVKAKLQD